MPSPACTRRVRASFIVPWATAESKPAPHSSAAAMANAAIATPSHTRSRAAPCFEDHYHPSSWYNKARVPSKLPTTAGNQAATAGPTSPEPPRSCISEVAT